MCIDQVEKVMAEYAKQGLEDPDEKFLEEDPMKFYVQILRDIITKCLNRNAISSATSSPSGTSTENNFLKENGINIMKD